MVSRRIIFLPLLFLIASSVLYAAENKRETPSKEKKNGAESDGPFNTRTQSTRASEKTPKNKATNGKGKAETDKGKNHKT